MHITEVPDCTIESITLEASPPRSEGLHLSTVIRSILADLDPKTYGPDSAPDWNRFEMGFTFERVLEHAFATRREDIVRPGEFVLDGIAMSPDGIAVDAWRLEEFKLTWKSMREAPHGRKFWPWIVQMKAYCKGIGAQHARLRALFVNGDYRDGYQPQFRAWDFEFSAREIDENWDMVVNHARAKGLLQ